MQEPTLANLMGMATNAEAGGNSEEALSYYNRVLEHDPRHSAAWLGKGRAAGMLSTLANVRVGESLIAFNHAIANADEADKPGMIDQAQAEMGRMASLFYGMALKHFLEFRTVPSARTIYVHSALQLSDALAQCAEWARPSAGLLRAQVQITRGMIDYGLKTDAAQIVRARYDESNARLAVIDPAYTPPALAAETVVEAEQRKADFDNLGYIVAFVLMILSIIVAAVVR